LPIFVGEVEIGVTVVFSDSDVNRALRGVKLGARLKQIERRLASVLAALPVSS
jgi:hypothetical protein